MSKCPFDGQHLDQLKAFIVYIRGNPEILQTPELSFFTDYLKCLGATLPTPAFKPQNTTAADSGNAAKNKETELSEEESEPEEELVLDNEGVIEADPEDANQEMGDANKQPTDDDIEAASEKRQEAMAAFSEQNFDKAIELYTEAIKLNPQSALLFAKRGQVYLKQNKPTACIKDCSKALELNCDSQAAYKFRGRAYRLLGRYLDAAQDWSQSCNIDYDEQVLEWLQEIKPNADKLRAHQLAKQRNHDEKAHREKLRRARAARKAQEDAKAANNAGGMPNFGAGGMPNFGGAGGMPNFGGAGTGPGGIDIMSMLNDPEVMQVFQDPEVAAAFQDVSANPANILKYQNNPKIAAVLQKLQSKFMGSGGAPGSKSTPPPPSNDDVGLD